MTTTTIQTRSFASLTAEKSERDYVNIWASDTPKSADADFLKKIAQPAQVTPPAQAEQDVQQDVKISIVYRSADTDSTYAAAMMIDALTGVRPVELIAIGEEMDYGRFATKEHLCFIGQTSLDGKFVEKHIKEGKRLTAFTYDDSLTSIDFPVTKKGAEPSRTLGQVEIVRPQREDYFGPLAKKVENTMIDLMHCWLTTNGYSLKSGALARMRIATMRMVCMAFPVTNDLNVDLGGDVDYANKAKGERCVPGETERKTKAMIYNLLPKLAAALRNENPADGIRAIQLNTDPDAYLQYWSDCFTTFARSKTVRLFKIKNTKRIGIYSGVKKETANASVQAKRSKIVISSPVMAALERQHLEMLGISLLHNSKFVSYEDMHGQRLWRIYSTDYSERNAIAHAIGGGNEVWDDGLCLRTYTNIPA